MTLRLSQLLILILAFSGIVESQTSVAKYYLSSDLKPIETDKESIYRLLSSESFTVLDTKMKQTYFLPDVNIDIEYSSGECTDAEPSDFSIIGSDIWNIRKNRVVRVTVQPKTVTTLSDVQFNRSDFRKEKLYKGFDRFVYFNKAKGIAIYTRGEIIEKIQRFPDKSYHDVSCETPLVSNFLSSNRWKLKNFPKFICILDNFPANVTRVEITTSNELDAKREVIVHTNDPENDPLSYNYLPSAGFIIGRGSKVIWDLTGLAPGEYSLKVAVDDGAGLRGRWLWEKVVLR